MPDTAANPEAVKAFFDRPEHFERAAYRSAVRGAIVRELLVPLQHAKILDLGCGDGRVSVPLLGTSNAVTLVDFAPRILALAAQRVPDHARDRVEIVLSPVDDFRPSALYDVVLCLGVLAHVPSIEAAVAKIGECLPAGGRAIVELTPNPLGWKESVFAYRTISKAVQPTRGYRLNQINPDHLVALAASNGLAQRRVVRHYVPLPGMSLWPDSWQSWYAFLSWRESWLSRFGVEYIYEFTKGDPRITPACDRAATFP